eukprot:gene1750-2090_t
MYVHQSRVNFKGTPNEFLTMVQDFCSQNTLSGLGANIQEAIAGSVNGSTALQLTLPAMDSYVQVLPAPKVLLLDEPTSACDHDAAV